MRQRTTNRGVKLYCVSLLEKLGSLEFARQHLLTVKKQIYDEIRTLGGNPGLIDAIDRVEKWKNDEIVNCYPEFEEHLE